MKNKILISILFSFLLLLGGCQLAKPEGESASLTSPDAKMIGVFITDETLHLPGDKLYAQKIYKPDSETNSDENWSFAFPDLDGYLCASYVKTGPSGEEYWSSTFSGEGVCEQKHHLTSGDINSAVEMSGTIYLTKEAGTVSYYLFPVYQDNEGNLYLTTYGGTGLQNDMSNIGSVSTSLASTLTWNQNNATHSHSFRYDLALESAEIADSVEVLYMNASHQELRRETYLPHEVPAALSPEKEVAYLLIEEHYADKTIRKVCQPEDDTFCTFYEIEDHICIPKETQATWEK